MSSLISDVCFMLESGHSERRHQCPLSANSGHESPSHRLTIDVCYQGPIYYRSRAAHPTPSRVGFSMKTG